MDWIHKVLLACVFTVGACTVKASPMNYTFDIDWYSGTLAGTSSPVALTIDGYTGVGIEVFQPFSGLMAFSIVIEGVEFSITDDHQYPNSPTLAFEDGVLFFVNAGLQTPPGTDKQFSVTYHPDYFDYASYGIFKPDGELAEGSVNVASFGPQRTVPATATLPLLGMGLAAIGYSRRKRKPHS
ncbi:MAG: hypothetical protein KDI33_15755 [Halioglobus sp.]|nr:hypothetical protein [Halioglobus sp.]